MYWRRAWSALASPRTFFANLLEVLRRGVDAPYLIAVPRLSVYVALFAWRPTSFGLVLSLCRSGL